MVLARKEEQKSAMTTFRRRWADMTEDSSDDEALKKELDCIAVKKVHQEAAQTTAEVEKVACLPQDQKMQLKEKSEEKLVTEPQKLANLPLHTKLQTCSGKSFHLDDPTEHCSEKWKVSSFGLVATMLVFDTTDSAIHVKKWLRRGPLVVKRGQKTHMWLARVSPQFHGDLPCEKCKQSSCQHDQACKYKGQTPCSWCNRYTCKHDGHGEYCSRKNFGCSFCHYFHTGHCLGNEADVVRYKLNAWCMK